jgi:hypothetical protein
VVGHGWDAQPPWAAYLKIENAYYTDTEYIRKLRVETLPPIPFQQVIQWMSKARFNPVLSRPTFVRMRLVTPRFLRLCGKHFPLFNLDDAYVKEIYGEAALELVLLKRTRTEDFGHLGSARTLQRDYSRHSPASRKSPFTATTSQRINPNH